MRSPARVVLIILVWLPGFACAGARGGGPGPDPRPARVAGGGDSAGAARDGDRDVGGAGVVAAAADAGAELVATAPLGSLALRKWRLGNGLTILTVPDPAARSVSYVSAFRVGSRDENADAGETGLAHLCEHLLFTRTRGAGDPGEFDQRIEEAGGSSNAATSYDFTSYVDDVPPAAIDRVVRLEANRMVNLDLTPAAVAAERDIVVEERLGAIEDSVDGLLDEMVWGQAFRTHPYRFPIIGRMADIKAVTRDRVWAFYRRHYAPDRAVVVIAGRIDEAAALRAIAGAYGGLARGAAPAGPAPAPERAPAAEARATIARPVPADRFVVGYAAPALGGDDRAAFDLLDEVMAGGPSSRLHHLLVVERELASSLDSDVAPTRDPGLWTITVQMTKGQRARAAEALIARELDRVAREPVPAAELAAARGRLETAFWSDLGASHGRAEALAEFEATTGDFRTLLARGAAYATVTAADVTRVARAYLAAGARAIVVATPVATPRGGAS